MSTLQQKLDLTGAPAGVYTGYIELDGDIGSIGPNGLGLAVFKPIKYDSDGNLKAENGTSDYVIAAAVGGYLGHVARASLTILLNGQPVGGVLKFDLIESSPDIVDIKALYLQGKVQPVTPGQLANLTDMLVQGATLVPQMQQSLADTAQAQATLLRIAGVTPWAGGDHNTLPNPAGDYLITRGPEQGQVWTRLTAGANPIRSIGLESTPLLYGTRAQRLALTISTPAQWFESDGVLMTYAPGPGWRGPNGENIDNPPPPPPPDTGGF